LPIGASLNSATQKDKKEEYEEYIVWFPVRYKKEGQIITDFATLKVNRELILGLTNILKPVEK